MKKAALVLIAVVSLALSGCDLLLGPSYSVTYQANGASGTAPSDPDKHRKNESVLVLGPGSLAKTDYSFHSWNTKGDGTGTAFSPGDHLTMGSQDFALYAIWTLNSFKALGGGAAVSLAAFNAAQKYCIIAAEPASKPEANSMFPEPTKYYYSLTSAALGVGDAASRADGAVLGDRAAGAGRSLGPIEAATGQAKLDLRLRAREDELLAQGRPQANRAARSLSRAAPHAPVVGTTWNGVYVWSSADNANHLVDTTCRRVSDHAYIFVDNSDLSAMEPYLATYATAFDSIYHVDQDKFGAPNDVDSNGKIIIVFSHYVAPSLGYFYSADKYVRSADNPDSNEGDIFYATTDSDFQGGADAISLGTLAHELQHMIYFDQHANRGVTGTYAWLNEALSQAAQYYNGYKTNQENWINSFLSNYGVGLSLTHWTSQNYGYGAIFIHYLIGRYGDAAIKNMCSTANIGIHAVEAATGDDFNDIFDDFTRAIAMSGTGDSANPDYAFSTINLSSIQTSGRTGLLPYASYTYFPGDHENYWVYAYGLEFLHWHGSFGSITLSGTDIAGTAFGLSR